MILKKIHVFPFFPTQYSNNFMIEELILVDKKDNFIGKGKKLVSNIN